VSRFLYRSHLLAHHNAGIFSIFAKLRELGWGDEIEKTDSYTLRPLTTHPLVKKPQELTDRIWNNIKQPLIEILQEFKEKRLMAERIVTLKKRQKIVVTLLKAYALEQPVAEVIPGPADVCNMNEFKIIVEDAPNDVEIGKEDFKEAMDQLPRLIQEWRYAKDTELVSIINKNTAPDGIPLQKLHPKNDHKQLELTTTIFKCRFCYTSIAYPRILVHSCMHILRESYRDYEDPRFILWRNMEDEPWNFGGNRVEIDSRALPAAKVVLESCALDPATTTTKEMDDLDARFECLKCYDEKSKRLIMGWRTAVWYLCFLLDIVD
jgi:hypothetical protein